MASLMSSLDQARARGRMTFLKMELREEMVKEEEKKGMERRKTYDPEGSLRALTSMEYTSSARQAEGQSRTEVILPWNLSAGREVEQYWCFFLAVARSFSEVANAPDMAAVTEPCWASCLPAREATR